MKKLKTTLAIISAALIVISCSKSEGIATMGDGELGVVTFDCSAQSSVSMTRADDGYAIPDSYIPDVGDLNLKITGTYVDAETETETDFTYGSLLLSVYNDSPPYMYASSDYKADFSYGDASAEGESAAYFAGSVDFEVIARGNTTESASVSLQNSIISLELGDDVFEEYYQNATFTVSTGSGNNFSFTVPDDKIIFVQAGTSLTLSGSATKASTGESVQFSAAVIGQTTARTMSRITITADGIGGEEVNITVDDTITPMDVTTIELNPQ